MPAPTQHFLLFSETTMTERGDSLPGQATEVGRWRIVLESLDGTIALEASDEEEMVAERLELLAVVRGLEAIPEPAKVTLVTASRYVSRGLRFGLAEWRENGWEWERYGEMTPVAHRDLWQRVDRALRIHEVRCRTWRFDEAPVVESAPVPAPHWRKRSRTAGRATPAELPAEQCAT